MAGDWGPDHMRKLLRPDPADVHTGTDRVELTDAEREEKP